MEKTTINFCMDNKTKQKKKADLFYSEANMKHLKKSIRDLESGKTKLTPHELIGRKRKR